MLAELVHLNVSVTTAMFLMNKVEILISDTIFLPFNIIYIFSTSFVFIILRVSLNLTRWGIILGVLFAPL